jgi:ribonucleoside-diphosphate reductase alpha chain
MKKLLPLFLLFIAFAGLSAQTPTAGTLTVTSTISTDRNGSVQHLGWLSDEEKLVFRTAFEMDMSAQLRLCSTRQPHVDQGQSINFFFSANEDEKRITQIHQQAFLDENVHSLYYIYTLAGVQAAKSECIACM